MDVPNRKPDGIEIQLTEALIKRAMGFYHNDKVVTEVTGSDNKKYQTHKIIKRYYPPDRKAIIFVCNNLDFINWIYQNKE